MSTGKIEFVLVVCDELQSGTKCHLPMLISELPGREFHSL